MFQLNHDEFKNLMFHFGTSSWGGTRKLPRAFTEQGVAMLSSVLNSKRAIQVNVVIMRAFVRLREIEDMRWYRKIYRNAVSLWPHYMSAIVDEADFPYLVGTVADAEAAHTKGNITKRDWDKYRIVMRDQA